MRDRCVLQERQWSAMVAGSMWIIGLLELEAHANGRDGKG